LFSVSDITEAFTKSTLKHFSCSKTLSAIWSVKYYFFKYILC